jgi:uracil-DNA glycosylase family 4
MNCINCSLAIGRNNVVRGVGIIPNNIMILGGVPSYKEDKYGTPFISKENIIFTELLKSIDIVDPYITNVVKCISTKSKISDIHINTCFKSFLYNELINVNPRIIITVGSIPSNIFIKNTMKEIVGNMYKINGYYIFPLYDIKYYINNNLLFLLKDHINKIKFNLYTI